MTPRDSDSLEQTALLARALSWAEGLGVPPAAERPERVLYEAIQRVVRERDLAHAALSRRAPMSRDRQISSEIFSLPIAPTLTDLRGLDVVRRRRDGEHIFVAYDAASDSLVSWRDGQPVHEARWTAADCRDDAGLCSLLRAGREAQFPWVYPEAS